MKKVHGSQNRIDACQASCSNKHQGFSPKLIDGKHPDECKDKIHTTGNNYIKQDIRYTITGIREDLLCIIKDNVYSAPLLKHSQYYAQNQ